MGTLIELSPAARDRSASHGQRCQRIKTSPSTAPPESAARGASEGALRGLLVHGISGGRSYNPAVVHTESSPLQPSRRDLLKAASLGPLAGLIGGLGTPSEHPPNVLILVADDQSRIDLSPYGHSRCPTPAIADLAQKGLLLDRFYTPIPLCQPSRAALYTGLLPQRNGVYAFEEIRRDVATWPELLDGHCFTGMIGKLNVAPAERMSFDFLRRLNDDNAGRSPSKIGQLFEELLKQAGSRRFCAVVNFVDPHRPFGAGEKAEVRFDPAEVWVPPFLLDIPEMRKELARYYDATMRMDRAVGRILEVLGKRAEDTLILYISDNGMPFPFAKSTLYEPGVNLPFLAVWPGVIPAQTRPAWSCSMLDLLPTVLEIFGAEAPYALDGRSRLPYLVGSETGDGEPVICRMAANRAGHFPSRSVRLGRWKYILNFKPEAQYNNSVIKVSKAWAAWRERAGSAERVSTLIKRPQEELFDLESDPWELVNLVQAPDGAAALAEVRRALADALRAEGDSRHKDVPGA